MDEDFEERLRAEAAEFAASLSPPPAPAVRARGAQRRRRFTAASVVLGLALLAGGGGGAYALTGQVFGGGPTAPPLASSSVSVRPSAPASTAPAPTPSKTARTATSPAPTSTPPATVPPSPAPTNAGGVPQLELRPASGPVGTNVTISGQLSPQQVSAFAAEFQGPGYFDLITDVQAHCATAPAGTCSAGPASLVGCELDVGLTHVINLDTATGEVTGSFTVGANGNCFQGQPTLQPQATLPGVYGLSIGCHSCEFAQFTVTARR